MPQTTLRESLAELNTTLQQGNIDSAERARLLQLHAELSAQLDKSSDAGASHGLRAELSTALERAERSHPHITSALSRVLDALSDLGV